jgi:hypothetical protein
MPSDESFGGKLRQGYLDVQWFRTPVQSTQGTIRPTEGRSFDGDGGPLIRKNNAC